MSTKIVPTIQNPDKIVILVGFKGSDFQILDPIWNLDTFAIQPLFDNSKFRDVRISDPCCTSLFKQKTNLLSNRLSLNRSWPGLGRLSAGIIRGFGRGPGWSCLPRSQWSMSRGILLLGWIAGSRRIQGSCVGALESFDGDLESRDEYLGSSEEALGLKWRWGSGSWWCLWCSCCCHLALGLLIGTGGSRFGLLPLSFRRYWNRKDYWCFMCWLTLMFRLVSTKLLHLCICWHIEPF